MTSEEDRKMDRDSEERAQGEPRGGSGWVKVPADRSMAFTVALACSALLIVGGLGPWASFALLTVAGTEGDGWFLVVSGIVAAGLLIRFNSREGESDGLDWLIPVAGAVGTVAVLNAIVGLEREAFVSVGWGAWIGAASGIGLIATSIHLLRPQSGFPVAAAAVTVAVVAAGIAIGYSSSDPTGSGEQAQAESLGEVLEDDWFDSDAGGEGSGDGVEASGAGIDEVSADDCDALGINAEEMNEGECESEGLLFDVVNRDSVLGLDELSARLVGIEDTEGHSQHESVHGG